MISLLIESLYWKELAAALEQMRSPGLQDLVEDNLIINNKYIYTSYMVTLSIEA
jgi:hypothetical protein